MPMPATPTPSTTSNPHAHDAILDTIAQRELFIDGLFARGLAAQPDTYPCATENLHSALQVAFVAGMLRAGFIPALPTAAMMVGDVSTNPTSNEGRSLWTGRIGTFRFTAEVYAEHPACTAYVIEHSRIMKLELRRIDNDRIVYAWDRGLDLLAIDATTQTAVDTVAQYLADLLYGPVIR